MGTFSNNNAPAPNLLDWQQFTYDFTAAGPTTTIALFNAVADLTQNEVGLDNVSLTAIPEPAGLALLGAGLGFLLLLRRRSGSASGRN